MTPANVCQTITLAARIHGDILRLSNARRQPRRRNADAETSKAVRPADGCTPWLCLMVAWAPILCRFLSHRYLGPTDFVGYVSWRSNHRLNRFMFSGSSA